MGASVAEPEPTAEETVEVENQTQLSLSVSSWDPMATAMSDAAVDAARVQTEAVLQDLVERRSVLEAAGPDLGLTRRDTAVAIPEGWAGTPGSPTYYLRVAEGFVRAAAYGTVCRDDFPESYFSNVPPPPDHWICGHKPPHPR